MGVEKSEKKPKAATIGFYHQGCQTSISTEKFPHMIVEQASPVVYLQKKPGKVDYSLLWNVRAEKESELDEYINYIKRHYDTKQLSVLEKAGNQALILIRSLSPSSSYEKVIESGTLTTSPVFGKEGYEIYNVLAVDPNGIKKFAKELSCIGDVKVMRVGDYKREVIAPTLTDKQREALQIALLNGYYAWPRNVGLVELARAGKISRRSMQERLRRAEAKLFPYAVKNYLGKKGEK